MPTRDAQFFPTNTQIFEKVTTMKRIMQFVSRTKPDWPGQTVINCVNWHYRLGSYRATFGYICRVLALS